MSARRAALLLGSAGLHTAVLALLALVAARAGFPPVLVVDLSAREAVAPEARAAPAAARAETGGVRRPSWLPPSVETAGHPSSEALRAAPVTPRAIADAAPAPSRALAGSAARSVPQEPEAAARAEGPGREAGADAHAAPRPATTPERGTGVQAPPGQSDRGIVTGPGGARSGAAGEGETGSAAGGTGVASAGGRGPVPGGSEAGRGIGLGGGTRFALALPGGDGGVPPEYGPYLARFRRRVQDALVYPLAARRRGLAGAVELHVLIDPEGKVQHVDLASSSSHAMLDEAAMDAVRAMAPLPLPEGLPRRPLRVKLPLVFELR